MDILNVGFQFGSLLDGGHKQPIGFVPMGSSWKCPHCHEEVPITGGGKETLTRRPSWTVLTVCLHCHTPIGFTKHGSFIQGRKHNGNK
jgi:hypothetical protein